MATRLCIRNLIFLGLLAGSQLQVPVAEVDHKLDPEISLLFDLAKQMQEDMGINSIILYTGHFDQRPSVQQLLMDEFSLPIYCVGSDLGPVKHRYLFAEMLAVVLFTGFDDPTLAALDDPELRHIEKVFIFIYAPLDVEKRFEKESIQKFFELCWDLWFDRAMIIIRGESELELWSYYYLGGVHTSPVDLSTTLSTAIRRDNHRFLLQVVNDFPSIFWYNSSEQADVTGGGNISLSGTTGLMMVEFMRHLNVTMDIIVMPGRQKYEDDISLRPSDQPVDVIANLVDNSSLKYSPVVAYSRICLVVSNRRRIPLHRFVERGFPQKAQRIFMFSCLGIFLVKYFGYRRRDFFHSLLSTFRFYLGIPVPAAQLNRMPLSEKILEVIIFFFVGLLISANISVFSTSLTTGIFEPEITNAETFRASGLKIMTDDSSVLQAFENDVVLSSLLDLVVVVNQSTMFNHVTSLNESYAYAIRTPNWNLLQLYQERMNNKPLMIAGEELCSKTHQMRIPISPRSPLKFVFMEYFLSVYESGLPHKWLQMSFDKVRELGNLKSLPLDTERSFKPLTFEFYAAIFKIYVSLLTFSVIVFVMEVLLKIYWK
ncbi:uncharacterized protein LOC108095101 [Drosophila ficusphila]|uniref:uncharacterized protein LOC108095101 n=1 Tax=Drosophila ficusphila TaxID=30025 RepID=UPI0007E87CBA|nr:uncharacterized protein LOC108095101 [Drosophila ficusphila]